MIEEPRYQPGMTVYEKAAFVERVQAEQAAFLASLRTVHSQAENRMLTRVARGGDDDEDGDDASVRESP
jgi:hypothetical protein